MMSVARLPAKHLNSGLKGAKVKIQSVLSFLDEDKIGTKVLRIGGYAVKRVLVDQGSSVEIIYPDLYKGLNLIDKDLTAYNSSLMSFEGKVVIPKGRIRLLVQAGSKVVEVDFIVVNAFSLYTVIVARPWLHRLGAISLTLHQKVKYPSKDRIEELVCDQSMARQCLVSAILHQPMVEPSASVNDGL